MLTIIDACVVDKSFVYYIFLTLPPSGADVNYAVVQLSKEKAATATDRPEAALCSAAKGA